MKINKYFSSTSVTALGVPTPFKGMYDAYLLMVSMEFHFYREMANLIPAVSIEFLSYLLPCSL